MASTYDQFEINVVDDTGEFPPAPGVPVIAHDVENAVDLPDIIVSDDHGIVPAGALDVPAGTLIRFYVSSDGHGRSGFAEDVTY